jgi:hypothetical protein
VNFLKATWGHAAELGLYAEGLVAAMGGADTGVIMDPSSNPYLSDSYHQAVANSDGSWITSWAVVKDYATNGQQYSWFYGPNPSNYENIMLASLSFSFYQSYGGRKAADAYEWLKAHLPNTDSFQDPKWRFLPRAGMPSCDVNRDGALDVSDVQLAVNETLQQGTCSSADLDYDHACTIVDVQRVIAAVLGSPCRVGP